MTLSNSLFGLGRAHTKVQQVHLVQRKIILGSQDDEMMVKIAQCEIECDFISPIKINIIFISGFDFKTN